MAIWGDPPINMPWPAGTVIKRKDDDTGWTPVTIPDTLNAAKRTETYLGTSDASGNYTVTYAVAFATTPDVQPQIQAGSSSDTRTVRITASSTTGFTVNVRNRTDVVGLLPSYANVSGASVGVLVTER